MGELGRRLSGGSECFADNSTMAVDGRKSSHVSFSTPPFVIDKRIYWFRDVQDD